MTTAQLNALTELVQSQAETQARQGDLIEEIAVGLFGPQRTELEGGGRWRTLGAIHRLDKVEADSLEALAIGKKAAEETHKALEAVNTLNDSVSEINKAMGNGGVPAKIRFDITNRRTQIWTAVIALVGTIITTLGVLVATWLTSQGVG